MLKQFMFWMELIRLALLLLLELLVMKMEFFVERKDFLEWLLIICLQIKGCFLHFLLFFALDLF